MGELDHKESWAPKNWCFRTVVLEKTLESPFDSKEIKPVHPKGNQPEQSLKGLMLKLKLLGPPDAKSQLTGKDPDGRKDWRQEEKRVTEDETVGWHLLHNGHEVEQTPGDSEGEGSLVCAAHGVAESETTSQLDNKCKTKTQLWPQKKSPQRVYK